MTLIVHLAKLINDSVRFSLSTRRLSVIIVLLLGLLLLALTVTAQAVAPLALYPFA